MLRKARIKEIISHTEYLIEDLLDQEVLHMRVSGKQRMHYIRFELGDEVYVMTSPYDPKKSRLLTSTDFRMDDTNSLNRAKYELDQKLKNPIPPQQG